MQIISLSLFASLWLFPSSYDRTHCEWVLFIKLFLKIQIVAGNMHNSVMLHNELVRDNDMKQNNPIWPKQTAHL